MHFRELLTFQNQGYAGLLKGPAATGKSESIKELAKILGKAQKPLCTSPTRRVLHSGNFFVVINCSPQSDRRQLEDLICGTVLSGTTLCLDEFNRLTEETMAWLVGASGYASRECRRNVASSI